MRGRPRNIRDDFGMRLTLARDAADLTQLKLGHKIGVRAESISDWERGRNCPSQKHLILLAVTLKVSADKLLGIG